VTPLWPTYDKLQGKDERFLYKKVVLADRGYTLTKEYPSQRPQLAYFFVYTAGTSIII